MAESITVFNSGLWVAFNFMRTVILVIGAALMAGFGWLAFEAGSVIGMSSAVGVSVLLGSAIWVIWRPVYETGLTAQQSLESLQRQMKGNNLKRLWSGIASVFGAFLILLISLFVFFDGSLIAGLLFFCSGVMAMRAAWALLWGRRGAWGKER